MSDAIASWSSLSAEAGTFLSAFSPWVVLVGGLGLLAVLGPWFVGLLRGGSTQNGSRGGGPIGSGGGGALSLSPIAAARGAKRRVKASGVGKPLKPLGSPRRQAVFLAANAESKAQKDQRWKDWHNDPYMTGDKGPGMRARAEGLSLKD